MKDEYEVLDQAVNKLDRVIFMLSCAMDEHCAGFEFTQEIQEGFDSLVESVDLLHKESIKIEEDRDEK